MELKQFCKTCNSEKEIVKVERNSESESVELTCGHRDIKVEHREFIRFFEQSKYKHKKSGLSKPAVVGTERTKISGETKRPTREVLIADRERNLWIHKVWESDENGKEILVHKEKIPLTKKGQEEILLKEG
jgi:hypothetical protein